MRNEAKRYVISIMLVLLVGVAYSQTQIADEVVRKEGPKETIKEEVSENNIKKEIKAEVKDNSETKSADPEKAESEEKKAEPAEEAKAKAAEARTFRATAYCLRGRTALGHRVRRGLIAADPRVLPLGTTVEITTGRYAGTYLVSDTGTKVKGRKIDIWVPSCSEALRWGHRPVKLRVVKKKKKGRK